jgi:hypothetical protein
MCCREALGCSFDVAASNLARMAQISLSGSTLRAVVENQGRAVLTAQNTGALRPGFTSSDCTNETMISGADGLMVPLVTEQQKRTRRATEAAKRKAQGRKSTARLDVQAQPVQPRGDGDGQAGDEPGFADLRAGDDVQAPRFCSAVYRLSKHPSKLPL